MTYSWFNEEQTELLYRDDNGQAWIIPASPGNRHYKEFLRSGAKAAPYDAGPPPPPPSTEEKVDQLLTDYNLTRDELRAALTSTQEISES